MSKKISLPVAIVIMLALVLATFMTTYTLVSIRYTGSLTGAYLEGVQNNDNSAAARKISTVMSLFSRSSISKWDEEAAVDQMLKAYAAATDDDYAGYYTAEEYRALTASNHAESEGIGISIIENVEKSAIEVILVNPDSPAEEAGLLVGDLIVYVGVGENRVSVATLGYQAAVKQLQGKAGTVAEFAVERDGALLDFSVERRAVTTVSVTSHVCSTDPDVGIIKLTGFDTQTPVQFDAAMDDLIAKGCRAFVFDVRHNPGGDLLSIKAVLARFLNDGDVILRTVYKDGVESPTVLTPYTATSEAYAGCNITKEDIGKYRGYAMAVLAGPSTASAAELFTACLQDYELALVVGETTFGKGVMQSIFPLENYGFEGGVKMTVAHYHPPFSDNYNDIGIKPDIEVTLNEEAAAKNIYKVTDEEDNQLQTAIGVIKASNSN